MKEIWKDIPDYEGKYQISNKGRVKGLTRIIEKKNGIKQIVKEKLLTSCINSGGYYIVTLSENNKTKSKGIHNLLSIAFMPNPLNKSCINHINGIKTDNRLSNLEWCSYSENIQHAFDTGLKNKNSQMKKVLMLSLDNEPLKVFDSQQCAENATKTRQSGISNCCRGILKTSGGYKWRFYEEVSK